jgi:hypothetical protein
LESGLNQRDRATGGFGGVNTHRKPGKFFYWRGFHSSARRHYSSRSAAAAAVCALILVLVLVDAGDNRFEFADELGDVLLLVVADRACGRGGALAACRAGRVVAEPLVEVAPDVVDVARAEPRRKNDRVRRRVSGGSGVSTARDE